MQAHPVPQNITGFEFKLIGFLTVRQFAYLAGAGILSLIIYVLPLFILIKILLILPLVLLGLALTFLPVNDQPFDRWLVAFIRSVYAPTRRVWHKDPKEIGFLAPEFSIYLRGQAAPLKQVHSDRSRLDRYLAKKKNLHYSVLDADEDKRLAQITSAAGEIAFPAYRSPVIGQPLVNPGGEEQNGS